MRLALAAAFAALAVGCGDKSGPTAPAADTPDAVKAREAERKAVSAGEKGADTGGAGAVPDKAP